MSDNGKITGNNGEWSEQYVMYDLLTRKELRGADRKLKETDVRMPVIKVMRCDKDNNIYEYVPKNRIEIFYNGQLIESIEVSDFDENKIRLYDAIVNKKGRGPGTRAYPIPDIELFLKRIRNDNIKDSKNKRDITVKLHDVMTSYDIIEGFSIKSYLGSEPTLLNASGATMFQYELKGCTNEIMNEVNSLNSTNCKEHLKKRMKIIIERGCGISFTAVKDEQFRKNLNMVDSNIEKILQEMLVRYYAGESSSVRCLINILEKSDPLGMKTDSYYEYKLKQVLSAFALGMKPTDRWAGEEDANGGFIVAKENGNVVCFFIYDRKELFEYLLDCTKIEKPSTSRYGHMTIYKIGEKYYMDICLQIRFVKPDHDFKSTKALYSFNDGILKPISGKLYFDNEHY